MPVIFPPANGRYVEAIAFPDPSCVAFVAVAALPVQEPTTPTSEAAIVEVYACPLIAVPAAAIEAYDSVLVNASEAVVLLTSVEFAITAKPLPTVDLLFACDNTRQTALA